jgi:hypothetical protein
MENDLGLIVTPLEEIGFGHRQTSEEDSGSGQSTIIGTRHPLFATQPKIVDGKVINMGTLDFTYDKKDGTLMNETSG